MIQPDRLRVPGEAAARARVEAVFEAADRLSPPQLWLSPVTQRDDRERRDGVVDLERIASVHGRRPLLDEARNQVRDELMERAVSRWSAESGAIGQQVGGRADDLMRTLAAIEDAVAVAVTEDLLDPQSAAMLSNPGRVLLGLPLLSDDRAGPSAIPLGGEPDAQAPDDDLAQHDPGASRTASDESAADALVEDELADEDLVQSSPQARRAAVFVIVAAVAVPAALSASALGSSLPLLLVILAASVLLAWLFG